MSNQEQPVLHEPFDAEVAKAAMRAYVKKRFTPLNEFAPHDSESETGFAWPEVELEEVLQEAFSGDYPDNLITEVAAELHPDGPWGIEDYDSDEK